MNIEIVRTCEKVALFLSLLVIGGCFATNQSVGTTLGVIVGAVVAFANLVLIRWGVMRAFAATDQSSARKSLSQIGALFLIKMLTTVAIVVVAIHFFDATAMGFMTGVTSVFASVILTSLVMSFQDPAVLDGGESNATESTGS